MPTTSTLTPWAAFHGVQVKVRHGGTDRASTVFGDGTYGEEFSLPISVPDQMVVLPNRRVDTCSRLRVSALSPTVITIQLLIMWQSVFGEHASLAAYKITLEGKRVVITPRWEQTIPTPTRDSIDIHAGGITAADYHLRTVIGLRSTIMAPIAEMLFDGNNDRVVDPTTFPPTGRTNHVDGQGSVGHRPPAIVLSCGRPTLPCLVR